MLPDEKTLDLREAMHLPADLSPTMLQSLEREAQFIELERGHPVFEDGDACPAFLAVTSGSIRVSKLAPDGRELLLYHVLPGEFCVVTLSCLLGGSPYPARGMTEARTAGSLVPKKVFEELLSEVVEFRGAVFSALAIRLTEVMALVEEVAFHRLDERVATHLNREMRIRGQTLETTHQELAESLGCSREIVSRILETFQGQGLVELGRKRIIIIDPEGLEQIPRPHL